MHKVWIASALRASQRRDAASLRAEGEATQSPRATDRFHGIAALAQLRVFSGDVAISTTEIGTERAMRAAILLGRAGAIRVTSERA